MEPQAKRLVAINARLVSSATFGDGIFGYLGRGGTVVFRQEDVGDGHWQPVFIEVNMRGRLLFLSLSLHQRIVNSDYEQLADNMTPKQIINLMINDLNAVNSDPR